MLNFSTEELEYIKKQMSNFMNIWQCGSKEELKQYIENITGE